MLRTAIPGAAKHTAWAKEGAAVTARIVGIEHDLGPRAFVRVEVKLESAEVGGMTVPLKAEANPANDSAEGRPLLQVNSGSGQAMPRPASEPPHRGSLRGDPGVYVFEVRGSGRDAKVGLGLVSSWVTAN